MVAPYDLVRLLERPNRQDYWGKIMYRWCQQKMLTGTALTWMVPNALGTPMELYCIPTVIAIPQPAINPDYPDGFYRIQPIYPYGPFSSYPTPTTAVGAPIPAQWMLRFQYPHPVLRYDGYSPLTALNLEMDEFKMIGRSRHYKMRRTVNPSVVLDTSNMEGAQMLPEEELERIRVEIENTFFGPENAGGLLAPPPGCDIHEWGLTPEEMDYPNSWAQMVDFLLAGFGITKPAAGMLDNSSYSTLFATLKQLYMLTLDPDFRDVAAELTHHLGPFFGDDLMLEITGRRIDDHDISFKKAGSLLAAKGGTVNEYRKLLDLPVTKEQWGGERLGQEQPPPMPGAAPGGAPAPAGAPGEALAGPGPENGPGGAPSAALPVEARTEPPEVADTRPGPGNLSAGALGTRKSLPRYKRRLLTLPPPGAGTKSLYDGMMDALRAPPVASIGTVGAKSLYADMMRTLGNGHD